MAAPLAPVLGPSLRRQIRRAPHGSMLRARGCGPQLPRPSRSKHTSPVKAVAVVEWSLSHASLPPQLGLSLSPAHACSQQAVRRAPQIRHIPSPLCWLRLCRLRKAYLPPPSFSHPVQLLPPPPPSYSSVYDNSIFVSFFHLERGNV